MKKNNTRIILASFLLLTLAFSAHQFVSASPSSATLTWPDSSQYKGDVLQNKPMGKGKMVWGNGSTYDGDWQNGVRTGQGTYVWPDGRHYQGDFVNDEMHGKGTATWPNGSWYKGDWYHNHRSGNGILVFANGDRYSGDFLNDSPHGNGTLIYKNGSIITGVFVFGTHQKSKPNSGFNTDINPDGKFQVTALAEGKIQIKYPNGNVYTGDFSLGWFEGKGTFVFSDGTALTGIFHNNRFIYGKKTYRDGSWYEGSFMDNYSKTEDNKNYDSSLRHGFGIYFSAEGSILLRGHWICDHFVDSNTPSESPKPFGPDDEDILI